MSETDRAPRKETFAVASKIKTYVRDKGLCAGSDLADAVSAKVVEMLDTAIQRTLSNARKTVKGSDL